MRSDPGDSSRRPRGIDFCRCSRSCRSRHRNAGGRSPRLVRGLLARPRFRIVSRIPRRTPRIGTGTRARSRRVLRFRGSPTRGRTPTRRRQARALDRARPSRALRRGISHPTETRIVGQNSGRALFGHRCPPRRHRTCRTDAHETVSTASAHHRRSEGRFTTRSHPLGHRVGHSQRQQRADRTRTGGGSEIDPHALAGMGIHAMSPTGLAIGMPIRHRAVSHR